MADLRPGQSILIYGASGAIGTAGVQLAREGGAKVTAVCNTRNLELVKSLGADTVIAMTSFSTRSENSRFGSASAHSNRVGDILQLTGSRTSFSYCGPPGLGTRRCSLRSHLGSPNRTCNT